MFKVTKEFSASENGCTLETYKPGEYESLPPVALAHGENIEAVQVIKVKKPVKKTKA
ncbi:MAG: hypothetical protein K6L81_02620 [Agarilytica sp.]